MVSSGELASKVRLEAVLLRELVEGIEDLGFEVLNTEKGSFLSLSQLLLNELDLLSEAFLGTRQVLWLYLSKELNF